MSDTRNFLANSLNQQADAKAARVRRNAASLAPTLGELARAAYKAEVDQEAAARKSAEDKQAALRTQFLRNMYARAMEEMPALLADTLELPADHKFITSLRWEVMTEGWDTAEYTVDGDTIRASARFDDRDLKERYVTVIDGHRVVATFYRGKGITPTMVLSGEEPGSSQGLNSLAKLGEWLERPTRASTAS